MSYQTSLVKISKARIKLGKGLTRYIYNDNKNTVYFVIFIFILTLITAHPQHLWVAFLKVRVKIRMRYGWG